MKTTTCDVHGPYTSTGECAPCLTVKLAAAEAQGSGWARANKLMCEEVASLQKRLADAEREVAHLSGKHKCACGHACHHGIICTSQAECACCSCVHE